MNLVVDCSFIMSNILPDENQIKIEQIYSQISKSLYKIYVPSIFYLECTNVLISALRRNRITKNAYRDYNEMISSLPINIDKFSSTPESIYTIGNLSIKYSLSSYDASYLELAMRVNAAIATLDKNLAVKCRESGIELAI